MLLGITFAIISSIFVAVGALFLKKSSRDFSPSVSFSIFTIFAVLIWVAVGFFMGINTDQFLTAFLYGLISAFFAQGVYYYIISKGELSITGTILASYSIYTVIFSIFFNNESVTYLQAFFIALNIIGTIIVSLPGQIDRNDISNTSYIIWPLIGAMSIGLSDAVSKNVINNTSVGTYIAALALAHIPIATLFFFFSREKFSNLYNSFIKISEYRFPLLGSFFVSIGTMLIFLSFGYAPASIAAPITASNPVILVVLALVFLKERLLPKDAIGLIMVIAGILGVSGIVG